MRPGPLTGTVIRAWVWSGDDMGGGQTSQGICHGWHVRYRRTGVQRLLQAPLSHQLRIFVPTDAILHGMPAPIWRSSHNTGVNFMVWKVEQLMLVKL